MNLVGAGSTERPRVEREPYVADTRALVELVKTHIVRRTNAATAIRAEPTHAISPDSCTAPLHVGQSATNESG